jgi:hypothetical protein
VNRRYLAHTYRDPETAQYIYTNFVEQLSSEFHNEDNYNCYILLQDDEPVAIFKYTHSASLNGLGVYYINYRLVFGQIANGLYMIQSIGRWLWMFILQSIYRDAQQKNATYVLIYNIPSSDNALQYHLHMNMFTVQDEHELYNRLHINGIPEQLSGVLRHTRPTPFLDEYCKLAFYIMHISRNKDITMPTLYEKLTPPNMKSNFLNNT